MCAATAEKTPAARAVGDATDSGAVIREGCRPTGRRWKPIRFSCGRF